MNPIKNMIRRVVSIILFALSVFYFHLLIGLYAFMAEPALDGGIRFSVASLVFAVVSVQIFVLVFLLITGYEKRAVLGDDDPSIAFWWYSLACNLFLLAPYLMFFDFDARAVDKSWNQHIIFYGSFPFNGLVLSAFCLLIPCVSGRKD